MSKSPDPLPIWFCVVLGIVLPICSIDCSGAKPSPSITSEGGKVGAEFIESYRRELAAVFRDAAHLVKTEKIISDEELLEHLQVRTETARKVAAEPIGVLLEKRLPNGELYAKDAAVLEELAAGLEGAK